VEPEEDLQNSRASCTRDQRVTRVQARPPEKEGISSSCPPGVCSAQSCHELESRFLGLFP